MGAFVYMNSKMVQDRDLKDMHDRGVLGIVATTGLRGTTYAWAPRGHREWIRARVGEVCDRAPSHERRIPDWGSRDGELVFVMLWVDNEPQGCVSVDVVTMDVSVHGPTRVSAALLERVAADLRKALA